MGSIRHRKRRLKKKLSTKKNIFPQERRGPKVQEKSGKKNGPGKRKKADMTGCEKKITCLKGRSFRTKKGGGV